MTAMSRLEKIHDVGDFPLVRFQPDVLPAGYSDTWCDDMELLLERKEKFVIVSSINGLPDESYEDRLKRVEWLKTGKIRCKDVLLAIIHVVPDAGKRAEIESIATSLFKIFNAPHFVTSCQEDAEALGLEVLSR